MEITQVKIHYKDADRSKLKAFVTMTIDHVFVVHDLKIIEGKSGLFVAMPSIKRKLSCHQCSRKNYAGAKYCNECGSILISGDKAGPAKDEEIRDDHKDIAHPITASTREYIQKMVLEAYQNQKIAAK